MGKVNTEKQPHDLIQRTFEFAVSVLELLKTVNDASGVTVVSDQLARSATSIGANYEESQASQSKDDFYYKIGICLREARETNYWLRIIQRMRWVSNTVKLDETINESNELIKILGKIFSGRK